MISGGRASRTLALWLAVATLAGCGDTTVQERLGLGKRVPDEFQVVRRAPLVLPPDYNLRPPAPGAPPPQQQDTSAQAEAILTGQPPRVPAEARQSQGELALLGQSPVEAEPGIRQVLVAENQELVNLDDNRFLFILNFQRRALQPTGPVIDPVAERQRLQQAAASAAPGSVVTMRTGSQPLLSP
ncbi:MAG TPA: DUF3035 domain-containing protein [Geminicoccaceae bacterium]|nr:DUF3035 domain-containing protein [Geminicoccaceae bacterium]